MAEEQKSSRTSTSSTEPLVENTRSDDARPGITKCRGLSSSEHETDHEGVTDRSGEKEEGWQEKHGMSLESIKEPVENDSIAPSRKGYPVVDASSDSIPFSPEDLMTAKRLVLDLLGWGVDPEYLVSSGISPEAIYRIFTDLNLQLPENLIVTQQVKEKAYSWGPPPDPPLKKASAD